MENTRKYRQRKITVSNTQPPIYTQEDFERAVSDAREKAESEWRRRSVARRFPILETDNHRIGKIDRSLDDLCARIIQLEQHLDNRIDNVQDMPATEGIEMGKMKIDRRVTIDGRVVRIRATSEDEYAQKLFALMGVTGIQEQVESDKHDFGEYALEWFNTFSAPNIEKATARTYERQLNLYWIPAFKGKAIEDITSADIQAVFNGMTSAARETKQKAKVVLNMIFEQALEDDLIRKNPVKSKTIRMTGRGSKETEVYSVEEMRYMVSHLDCVKDATDRAYLALSALHPLRLEEVLGLKYEDVDVQSGVIHVRRSVTHPDRNQAEVKTTKTEASRRDIAFVAQAANCIPNGKPDDFIFGGKNPLSYTQVRRMCERIRKDIAFDGNITPRRFRATVLTDIYDTTKDIKQAQAAAGHTTAAMTLKHYVKGRNSTANTAAPVASLYGLG